MRDLNNVYYYADLSTFKEVSCTHEKHIDGNKLVVLFNEGNNELKYLTIRFSLNINGVNCVVEGHNDVDYKYHIKGNINFGKEPENNVFAIDLKPNKNGLKTALGPATSPKCTALFNRKNDSMLIFDTKQSPNFKFDFEKKQYLFDINANSFSINIEKNVYSENFGIVYKPINKNNTFGNNAPVGFMTWYALMWDTNEETLMHNVEFQAKYLKKYGADTIWVDWEWYHNDNAIGNERCHTFLPDVKKYPNGLEPVAKRIKELGLIPAVWIAATSDVSKNDFIKENPETILFNRPFWCGEYFFDPTHPTFLNEFIPKVFKMLLDWGYEAIKWDGLPISIDFIDQHHDELYDTTLSTEQALRNVIKKARETIGENVYMLSCHGEGNRDITFAADMFDSARVGADIFKWQDFLSYGFDRLLRYYPLHNVVLYNDPDNVVVREEFNNDHQAQSRVSLVALLGTPYTFGDDLTKLAENRVDMIKRTIPVLDVHPMEIKSKERKGDHAVINLAVCKKWENYNVIDVFNTTTRKQKINLTFADDLDLQEHPSKYLVYEFWENKFIGQLSHSLDVELQPCQSKVYAIRKKTDIPQLLSTNRHISQGALEIKDMNWNTEEQKLSGVSETILDEEYCLYFFVPDGYVPTNLKKQVEKNVWCLSINGNGKEVSWEIKFDK